MTLWIIKSETDDPERALRIVAEQRTKGYATWIEDGDRSPYRSGALGALGGRYTRGQSHP